MSIQKRVNMHNQVKTANKYEKKKEKCKAVLIDPQNARKHAQPAKGRLINEQKGMEMLKECLLSTKKSKNMHNQLKDGQ